MQCEHCAQSCTQVGEDMSMPVFRAAMKFMYDEGIENVTFGGGEPTLNKNFELMMGLALMRFAADVENGGIFIVTNGTHRTHSLALAHLAQGGVIGAALSLDSFHDRDTVDDDVVTAFTKNQRPNAYTGGRERPYDLRDLRDVDDKVMARGRGRDVSGAVDDCVCTDLAVWPDGTMTLCGCPDSFVVGNVLKPKSIELPEDFTEYCGSQQSPKVRKSKLGYTNLYLRPEYEDVAV